MKKRRKELYLYYGLAILISLFIICGLISALSHKDQAGESLVQEDEKRVKQPERTQKKQAENPNIRVLLMTDGYANIAHPLVELSGAKGMILSYGDKKETWDAKETLSIAPDDARFAAGNIRIKAKEGNIAVPSIKRGCGTPDYSGTIELRATAEGIVMINELPVETYLRKVVPSEMPASYELEALKAQAVCARSYAYRQMEDYGYPEYEAHVNDSTDYQVYGNSEAQEASDRAVQETEGRVVRYNGDVVTTYYYSTSCGKTTSAEAWGTAPSEKNDYLKSVKVKGENGDYEKGLPWYRWSAAIPVQTLSNLVGFNTGVDVGTLESVEVTKTGPGGVALQIVASGNGGSVTVDTENKIRSALGGSGYKIKKQDGSEQDSGKLLPSAFFTIEKKDDMFVISGGGFGHGIGMSQNGANEMAKQGKSCTEILALFYQGTTVE